MYRRRRRKQQIAFSFDSFLDVVANVVGVIIRLILVAWVGARSYHAVVQNAPDAASTASVATANLDLPPLPAIHDPLEQQLAKHRQELEQQQERLLEQLRQCKDLEAVNTAHADQLHMVLLEEETTAKDRAELAQKTGNQGAVKQATSMTLADLEKRSKQLAEELRELEKLPPLTKTLHYHTPISRPVHSEELHFECRAGRVSFVDIQAFLTEVRRDLDEKMKPLQSQYSIDGQTGPIGGFRMRYTLERERGSLEGDAAIAGGSYRVGMTGWVIQPIVAERGEPAEKALSPAGEFRRLTEALDPEQTVVTLWVYPDSFALYRQLRDFLHEHNVEVAGRPLPPDLFMGSSRSGTASRGQ